MSICENLITFCSISTWARIIIWICVAHIWIITSTLIFSSIEGFDSEKELNYVDKYIAKSFQSYNPKLSDINSEEFGKFKKGYSEALSEEVYWRVRSEFNDAAKTYIFVLSSFTTLGNYGIFPQTWRGRLFYVFALPIGVLFYSIMLHNIAVEAFEVFAYAAVSLFPKRFTMWTIDQRELYEKIKVAVFALCMLVVLILMLALIAIIAFDSYLTGLYSAMNLVFTVSAPEELLSYSYLDNTLLALILTFIYFCAFTFLYIILYSVFILFRYNNLRDVVALFGKDSDFLSDIDSADEFMRDEESRELFYYNAKEQIKQYDYPVNSHPVPYGLSREGYSSDNSDNVLEVPKQRKMLRKKKALARLKLQRSTENTEDDDLIRLENNADEKIPNIEVTQPSPGSPPLDIFDDDSRSLPDNSNFTPMSKKSSTPVEKTGTNSL